MSHTAAELQLKWYRSLPEFHVMSKTFSESVSSSLFEFLGDEYTSIRQTEADKQVAAVMQNRPLFIDAMKKANLTVPSHAHSERGFVRFVRYAMKRARSSHPHNARWKPLMETYVVMCVADALEGE